MTENNVSLVRPASILPAIPQLISVPDGDEVAKVRERVTGHTAKEDLKWFLLNKYRVLFTEKITRDDLEELQYCLGRQYDGKGGWNREYGRRFVLKMGEYVQEDILRSEIAGLASLLSLMKPEDLEEDAGSHHLNDRETRLPPESEC